MQQSKRKKFALNTSPGESARGVGVVPTHESERQPTSIDFVREAKELHPGLIALRRQLHREPELGLDLPKTQAAVLEQLEGLPLDITTGESLSSVVAVLRGRASTVTEDRPTILLRGDMDALPIREETGFEFASVNGNMHACGHDLHTAGLVGAAKLLSAHADAIAGDVIFMFQPGEEGPGGAEPMIAEGVLDITGRRPDAAYGIHVLASQEAGQWSTRSGSLLAGCFDITVTVHGRGGHGSTPYAAIDPVPVAAEIVLALQSYATRRVNPFDPVVITVGEIKAGSAPNVIPDSAVMRLSARVLSQESIDQLHRDIPNLIEHISAAHGCTAETDMSLGMPATVNDPVEAGFALDELMTLFGTERVTVMPNPRLGSEDFSYVLREIPGAFLYLGAHPVPMGEHPATNHSPRALHDDSVLADQAAALAQLAFNRIASLNQGQS